MCFSKREIVLRDKFWDMRKSIKLGYKEIITFVSNLKHNSTKNIGKTWNSKIEQRGCHWVVLTYYSEICLDFALKKNNYICNNIRKQKKRGHECWIWTKVKVYKRFWEERRKGKWCNYITTSKHKNIYKMAIFQTNGRLELMCDLWTSSPH